MKSTENVNLFNTPSSALQASSPSRGKETAPGFTFRPSSPRPCGMTKRSGYGFTLIELLVVVLIIGILAAVAVPQYQKAVVKARMTEALTIGRAVMDAQKVYYLANGVWADDLADLDLDLPAETLNHWTYNLLGSSEAVNPRFNISAAGIMGRQYWNFRFVSTNEEKPNYIECYAKTQDKAMCDVCQSMTGDTNPSVGDNGGTSYNTYILPYQY